MEHLIGKLLQDFEQGKMTRRQLIQTLALAATATSAASEATAGAAVDSKKIVKAAYINHPGYRVADYGRSRDWYADLFGMKVVFDDGTGKAQLAVGESKSFLIFHSRNSASDPIIDHMCFTIANWDTDKNVRKEVGDELKRRGLAPEVSNEAKSEDGRGWRIKDPDGLRLQLGGKDQ